MPSGADKLKKAERERLAPAADQAQSFSGFAGSRTVYGLVHPRNFLGFNDFSFCFFIATH